MLPTPKNYAIWPSVIEADKETALTIIPTEKSFLFLEDKEYSVTVVHVNIDETNYAHPNNHVTFPVTPEDGIITFSYFFPDEQEHTIVLNVNGKPAYNFYVYSLREDLYALRPLKGDLHAHSYRSDGRRDPSALAGYYREYGYDFFALTDHNRYYPGEEIDDNYKDVKLAFQRVKGEEVHVPGNSVHIVHVGGKSSVADLYVHDREKYEAELETYIPKVPSDIPEKYVTRYAQCMWATDKIHEAGGLAIFPHPYWRPSLSKAFNVCDEFATILLKSGMFDAYELIGGMKQIGNNRSVALWGEVRASGVDIPVVGSSDVHGIEKSDEFPHLFTICFAAERSNDAIIDAVRNGMSVAVESCGTAYDRQHRCYGSLRLVSYAQFLLSRFFPQQMRICQGEGIAMRNYSMDLCGAEVIELQAKVSESFALRFFGKEPPILPSDDVKAFTAKWREVQLSGPATKGSHVDGPVNRQL